MIRIISVQYKGRILNNISTKKIRPTQSRVKKSMLQILEPFNGKVVLSISINAS